MRIDYPRILLGGRGPRLPTAEVASTTLGRPLVGYESESHVPIAERSAEHVTALFNATPIVP